MALFVPYEGRPETLFRIFWIFHFILDEIRRIEK